MPANLTGIAIIGKTNEPLYLYDCSYSKDLAKHESKNDPFDFQSLLEQPQSSLPLAIQLIVYAALDVLEEMVSTSQPANQQPIIKNPNISMPNLVGLLLELDDHAVYATVSATNIKFLAITQGKASSVKEIHVFLKEIQQHFIAYIMNPFASTKGPICSQLFHEQVRKSVDKVLKPVAVVD